MADIQIEPTFKKLYARTLRLGIDKYLLTNRFKEILIENNIDTLWNRCYTSILRNNTVMVLSANYTGDHRGALGLFIEDGFPREGWLDGFIALLIDFAKWSKEETGKQPDLTPIAEALAELGHEAAELSQSALARSRNPSMLNEPPPTPSSPKTPVDRKPKTSPIHTKPRLFIGSSGEALQVAEALSANLDHDFECTIWTQGVFGLSTSNLESLEDRLKKSDFAVLVVTPDDVTESRGSKSASPRDNVVFELGLFMGALGRKRTFVVQPRHTSIKIPSDLSGFCVATYDDTRSDGNMRAATNKAYLDIKEAIKAAAAPGQSPE